MNLLSSVEVAKNLLELGFFLCDESAVAALSDGLLDLYCYLCFS